jgi:hypothetical protein
MARTRNGRFGKAVDERVTSVCAVLRKGAHDKRLHTSELTQTALDGAGVRSAVLVAKLGLHCLAHEADERASLAEDALQR